MNLSSVIAKRYVNLLALNASPEKQALALAASRADVAFWVNEFVWTYDPRETDTKTLPFTLFPKQEEFFTWLQDREKEQRDGITEKCREVGLTWLCCAYAVHGWLFRPEYRVGFGSRKLELVDTLGDAKCIFEKIRFIINNLPKWMRPAEYSMGYCKILNLSNGSSISGEGGDDIGRGDRATIYFVDEAAYLERSDKVDAALSYTSRCKIWVSTPNGPGNAFARKRHSGKFSVFTFRWWDDKRKDQAWYDQQKLDLDPVTLAQEVDIDYTASIEGICIPALWVRSAVDACKKLNLPQTGPLLAALDIAAEGGDENVLGFRRGVVVDKDILHWSGITTTASAFKAREECERREATNLNFDNGGGYGEPVAQLGRGSSGMKYNAMNGGESPSEAVWPDKRTSKEKFSNSRAEWWWCLRERFRKTYEVIEDGREHPLEDLISIPQNETLIAQLSMPLVETTDTGKTQIESKKKMKARGVKSPDFADMLAYLFAPTGTTAWASNPQAMMDLLRARETAGAATDPVRDQNT